MSGFNILSLVPKQLILTAAITYVSAEDPAAGKLIGDAQTAMSDHNLSFDEAVKIGADAFDEVAVRFPKFAKACASAKQNLLEDVPNAVLIEQHLERTIDLFKTA